LKLLIRANVPSFIKLLSDPYASAGIGAQSVRNMLVFFSPSCQRVLETKLLGEVKDGDQEI